MRTGSLLSACFKTDFCNTICMKNILNKSIKFFNSHKFSLLGTFRALETFFYFVYEYFLLENIYFLGVDTATAS